MAETKILAGLLGVLIALAFVAFSGAGASPWETSTAATLTVPQYIDASISGFPVTWAVTLNPDGTTKYAASGNPYKVNITANTNIDTNLTLKGDAFFNWTTAPYTTHYFLIGNLSYYNESVSTSSIAMTTSYSAANSPGNWTNIPASGGMKERLIHFWVTIPTGQYAADYNTTLNIQVAAA